MSDVRYPLSRNYKKLRYYLDQGMVIVCFADYKVDGTVYRDVCKAVKDEYSGKYRFFVRGMEYCSWDWRQRDRYDDYPEFETAMRNHNIEYIDFV